MRSKGRFSFLLEVSVMNPIKWYLDMIASWGLIPTEYVAGEYITAALFVGVIGGLACLIAAFVGLIYFFAENYIVDNFDDNLLTLIGYRITSTAVSLALILLAGGLGLCLITTVAGLIMYAPLMTLIGVLVLGPLLMLAGKIKWRRPNLHLRRKQKVTAQVPSYDSYEEAFELGEDFHTIDYEGEKIIMPN